MKTVLFKRIIISVFLQSLFALSLFGQKYENGTRLLKGAEVLSATPLQLDYVLENLSDTAKITTNIHEGKTHLILNDGSGKWHEWWYFMGKWQQKQNGGSSGLENSIQTKHGDGFSGSTLGINEGFIKSLDETPSDVGINAKNATVRVTPNGQAVMEATKGNLTNHIYVAANETEQNVMWISQSPRKGAQMRMDTTMLEHWQTSAGLNFWNFKSSLPDTTFYVKKRIRFDQPKTSVYIKNGDLRLTDKSGDYALTDLANKAETDPSVAAHVKSITSTNVANWNTAYTNSHTHSNKAVLDGITAANVTNWNNAFSWGNHATQGYLKAEADPVWTAAQGNYFTKTNLQTSGQGQVHWDNITNKPASGTESDPTVPDHVKTITSTNIANWNTAYTNRHTHANKTVLDGIAATNVTNWNNAFSWGNHATQGYLKTEIDPLWTAAQGNYYTKTNLQTSGGASVHWDNITNKPSMGTGSVTSVALSLPNVFSVTGSPVTSAGMLSATLTSQTKNMVFAAPATANGTPTFRALQESDLPDIAWSKITTKPTTVSGYGISDVYTKTNMQMSGGATVHWDNITNKPVTYTLPAATTSTLGGIKVGSGLSVTADGTLSATGGGEILDITSVEKYAGYKVYGNKVYVKAFGNSGSIVDDNSMMSNPSPYLVSTNIRSIIRIYGNFSEGYSGNTKTMVCPVNGRIWYNYEGRLADVQWLCWVDDGYLRFRYIKSGAQAPSGTRSYIVVVEYTKNE